MNETLIFIDSYFSKDLSDSDKKAFEDRCISDPEFAKEVAFYVAARNGLKSELYIQKKEEFSDLYHRLSLSKSSSNGIYRKLLRLTSLVAACLLIFFGWQMFFMKPSPHKLAEGYFKANLDTLSKTMDGSPDSLQTGISAYNKKQYQKAEIIFKALSERKDPDPDAIENLGLVYFAIGDYDNALIQFDKLSGISGSSFANRGPFYKALTLMKRSAGNDMENAKKLLQQVVDEDLHGRKDAEIWLKKL